VARLTCLGGALAVAAVACAGGTDPPPRAQLPEGPVGLRFRTLDGETRTVGALRGKVVVVHVLTTWSDPALLEVPRLEALARREPERVRVIGLVLDREPETAAIFAETFEVPYTVGRVPRPAWFTSDEGPFGPITVIPTSVVLDRAGRLAARSDGAWPPGVLERVVAELL